MTWSDLSGNDAGKFEFSNTGVLTFKVSPNFEQQPEYEVTLNAFDGGFTGSLTVTVTIADVNEPPVVAAQRHGPLQHREEQRDGVGSSTPWTRSGRHADVVAGGRRRGRFEITERGVLSFKMPPDYESSDLDDRPTTYRADRCRSRRGQTPRADGQPRRDRPGPTSTSRQPSRQRHPQRRRKHDRGRDLQGHGPRRARHHHLVGGGSRRQRLHDHQRRGALVRQRPQLRGQVLVHGDCACIRRDQRRPPRRHRHRDGRRRAGGARALPPDTAHWRRVHRCVRRRDGRQRG